MKELPTGRTLILASDLNESIEVPFVAMLSANIRAEHAGPIAVDLAGRGCVEVCFVGTNAETAHDLADAALEDCGRIDVVTTWEDDPDDGCAYFLSAAAYGTASVLVAFVADDAALATALERSVASYE